MTLILTIMIFLSCIAMLAIGIIFSRKPLKGGGCCKVSDAENIEASSIKKTTDT
ncbi:hypothetical protein [Vibrio neptunius]|uniref:hypothetical protein n=1 Tax=Vibrio neptunius TaxID=170651 RepID=UPI0030DAA21A